MDYTVHGILQARILEWVAILFSRESFQPMDRTQVSRIAGRFFTSWATREALLGLVLLKKKERKKEMGIFPRIDSTELDFWPQISQR